MHICKFIVSIGFSLLILVTHFIDEGGVMTILFDAPRVLSLTERLLDCFDLHLLLGVLVAWVGAVDIVYRGDAPESQRTFGIYHLLLV